MKGRSTMRVCLVLLAVSACALALVVSAEAAGAQYIPVDLGYPFGYGVASVTAVNDAGEIVGSGSTSNSITGGMSWTQAAGFSSNPVTETINAISPGGRVAGGWPFLYPLFSSLQTHAFAAVSADDPQPIDLGTLGGYESDALGINDAGAAVGYSTVADTAQRHAFVWTQAGGMLDIGTLGGVNSTAYGINGSGVVVGSADAALGAYAFRWTKAGGMVELGALGSGIFSVATAISNTGQIVGYSQVDSIGGPTHAFSWTQSGGMVDLGALPGEADSAASAVSDSGRVVGSSASASGVVPFTWTQSEGMSALPPLGIDDRVTGVNAAGWIVGDWLDGEHKLHGIIWRPSGSQPIVPSALHLVTDIRYGIPVSGLNTSNTRTLWISGYGEPGGTVTLYRDGVVVGALTIDSESSSWSIGDMLPADGVYSYTAKLSAEGRDSPVSPPLVVTVDTTEFAATIDGPGLLSGPPRPGLGPGDGHPVRSTRGVRVAIGRARATTRPRAGRTFAVTFAVTKPGTSAAATGVKITVAVHIGPRSIHHITSFHGGKAHTTLLIPAGSRGKLLTVKLTARSSSGTATRVVTFRVQSR